MFFCVSHVNNELPCYVFVICFIVFVTVLAWYCVCPEARIVFVQGLGLYFCCGQDFEFFVQFCGFICSNNMDLWVSWGWDLFLSGAWILVFMGHVFFSIMVCLAYG